MASYYFKQYKNSKAVGYPITFQNMKQVFPALDLFDVNALMAVGYCEYHKNPEPQTIDNPYLQEWVEGADREVKPGVWENTWILKDKDLTPEQVEEQKKIAYLDIKKQRNYLLAKTDFLGLPDSPPMSPEMKKYRQDLRDLIKNTPDPFNVNWPVNPEDPDGSKDFNIL